MSGTNTESAGGEEPVHDVAVRASTSRGSAHYIAFFALVCMILHGSHDNVLANHVIVLLHQLRCVTFKVLCADRLSKPLSGTA